ncbi:minor tail protein [Gordonia phage Kiko]|nr:minor tail protein [Gordonia phage Kiko]
MTHPAPSWSGPDYLPAVNVPSTAGGPQGMSDMSTWTKDDFEAWLAEQWQATFGKTGIGVGALRELVHAIISAFQGDIEPLEDLIEESIRNIPLVGDLFADFWDAIRGEYEGDVTPLMLIQALFAPIRKVLEIFSGRSSAVDATSADVASFWSDWQSYISGVPVPSLGSWFAGAVDLGEIEAAIADLGDIAPTSPVTPAYVADINDMATCSRDDLIRWTAATHNHSSGSYSANTTTGNVSGSSASTVVSLSPSPATYKPSAPTGASPVAPVDYTPIVVDRRGVVKKLRWRVGNDTSIFSIDAYYMALCIYNPNTGNIEKVWDSGNIKDGVADTTSLREVAVDLGIDQECVPGQILFVAHQQIAPGLFQESRTYACKPQAGSAARPGQLLDAWYYRTPGNVGSIPSSVSLASLSRRNDHIPWAAVEVDTSGEGA